MLLNVTFHPAQLVCEADPRIGCGCRAKQVIAELQTIPGIREAWVHRRGHAMAVRWWAEPDWEHADRRVRPVLAGGCGVVPAPAPSQLELDTFPDPSVWLRGSDVDDLSDQEARTIAQRVIARLCLQHRSFDNLGALHPALVAGLRDVLIDGVDMPIETRFVRMVEATMRVLEAHLSTEEFERIRWRLADSTLLLPAEDPAPDVLL